MDALERRARLARSRLYFVTEHVSEDILDAALSGGVDIVQLREKEMRDDDLVAAAEPFRHACERHGALFVLNDRPGLVERCGADGVHVGQGDGPVDEVRRALGPDRLIGLSTHSREEMQRTGSADYIGVGTIFATPTKPDSDERGLELVRIARYATTLPWFAIGGIDASNVEEVAANGAWGVAVVRALRDADDPERTARALRDALPPTDAVVTDGSVSIPQLDWLRAVNARAAPHVHREHTDVFYLLEGELEFRAGEGTVRVPAGSCVAAEPLLVHGFRNPGSDDAHYLNLHVPGGWARAPQGLSDSGGVEDGSRDARPIVRAPGDGDRLTGAHRLATVKVDRPELALLEYVAEAGYSGAGLHVHLRHADCFHVLEGELEVVADGVEHVLGVGESVVIPPGVPHSFAPRTPRVRFLNVHAPSCGFVEYMRRMDAGESLDEAQYDVYDV